MKKTLLLAAAVVFSSSLNLSARGTWKILTNTYTVDTLYHATIGPGTTETELRIEATVGGKQIVNNVFYTTTDLANPYVEMKVGKAGNEMRKLETVPEIAERLSKPGKTYFAGVNADFFNMGSPYNSIGTCIADGFLTNYATDGADIDPRYIVFDENGVPTIVTSVYNAWEGRIIFPSGGNRGFYVNTGRAEDEIVIYTPQWQYYNPYDHKMYEAGRTGTNQYGVEVKVRPVGTNVMYGNRLQLEVIEDPETGVGNAVIPSDGYVISAHGASSDYLSALRKGDIVITSIGFSADSRAVKAKELVGGFPRILNNGTVTPVLSYPGHLSTPEPRSAVGYNSDKTKLYMAVVDGRNAGGSYGVTQRELGAIMHNIGCNTAMNFDGGGSSTMYVEAFGIKNVPSSSSLDQRPEGQPRTVVNALFAVAVAPVDNTIASIELRDKRVDLTTGESYAPVVYGYNQYGVLISTDVAGCTFRIPAEVATVDGNRLVGAEGNYSAVLTADYNGATYSVPVYLNGGGDFVAGINEISADHNNVTPEYYMLNGVRTDRPQTGRISIVKKGDKTSKILNVEPDLK